MLKEQSSEKKKKSIRWSSPCHTFPNIQLKVSHCPIRVCMDSVTNAQLAAAINRDRMPAAYDELALYKSRSLACWHLKCNVTKNSLSPCVSGCRFNPWGENWLCITALIRPYPRSKNVIGLLYFIQSTRPCPILTVKNTNTPECKCEQSAVLARTQMGP